jgi:eukaryotic-like serine/threonine-protein kinase
MHLDQIGPYRIVRRLGKGGMGTVFQAAHVETGQSAAVKLLAPNLAEVEGFRDRFEAEVETLRKLNHPNIVRLFGFGEQDRQLFYAMELIAGSSLEEELAKGRRFDWREVVRIAVDVCKALRHAHDRGIVHRDIKPGNILLSAEGQVKIADFGIARLFGNSKLTIAGAIIGTAEYMAPEQAAGKPVEPRADLYSLGAVMYVLLARRPLFKGKSAKEVIHKQQYEIPEPLRHFNPDVPEELERLIAGLLEKEPERRTPNAMVLGRVLEAMQQSMTLPGETVQASRSQILSPDSRDAAVASSPPVEGAAKSSDGDCAATSDFPGRPTPAPSVYIEPASDPLAVTVPASSLPVLAVEPEAKPEAKEPPKPATRFVAVREDELGRPEIEEPVPIFSLSTVVLIVALLLVGGGMWYFLQPPTADGLYNRIVSRVGDESIESVRSAEEDIQRFLDEFSNDPRAKKIRGYQREIELYQMERKLAQAENPTPAERAYADAIAYEQAEPEKCAAKLQALVDLYTGQSDLSGPAGNCVELARRHLKQVRQEIAAVTAEQLPQLQARLDRADELKATEPDRAAAMYRAVVELYSPKPWAAPAVERAKAALAEGAHTEKIEGK